ncbi:insulin-like growth factor-binding protein 7 [Callorhinchus milii]|nr:insulin-like growth factor-binding protein 7 [Callorhinchus milii]
MTNNATQATNKLLNKFFASVFTKEKTDNLSDLERELKEVSEKSCDTIHIITSMVAKQLCKLKGRAGQGGVWLLYKWLWAQTLRSQSVSSGSRGEAARLLGSRDLSPRPAMRAELLLSGLWLLLVPALAGQKRVAARCPPCQPGQCPPLPPEGCPRGRLSDRCGCCSVCAAGPGEPCGGREGKYGRCARGYECERPGGPRGKGGKGRCVCKSPDPVCGSDGVSYSDGCDLRAAANRALREGRTTVSRRGKGGCDTEPVIVTQPNEIWNITGSHVYLSCEVIGIPTPILTWNKLMKTETGVEKMELLPGDRDNLAIQTRGGPEKHEVTGWVLISPLTEDDAGVYECHASNFKGEATANGSIHVVHSAAEIRLKSKQEKEA